jgi:hypothetical protein
MGIVSFQHLKLSAPAKLFFQASRISTLAVEMDPEQHPKEQMSYGMVVRLVRNHWLRIYLPYEESEMSKQRCCLIQIKALNC